MHMTISMLYTSFLIENNISYDIIYIDKYGINEKSNATNLYRYETKKMNNIFSKLVNIIKFSYYAKKIVNNNKYKILIIWNEITALLFQKLLCSKYNNRYIVNIRDYGFSDYLIIKNKIKSVISNSAFTCISSDKFMDFLPKSNKYIFLHSYNTELLANVHKINKTHKNKIKILFIGKMSYLNNAKKIVMQFSNDKRFILKFVGTGSENLLPLIKKKNIENVEIVGAFPPIDTAKYLQEADIIYNLYDVGNKAVDTAISIKFYYAMHMAIPILVYEKTYMDLMAKRASINISIPKKNISNLNEFIYRKYSEWDPVKGRLESAKMMMEVLQSHDLLHKKIIELLVSQDSL